ncbi:hypothetical protein AMTRI_Chr11g157060 [Amborella trichopoda]|uniref:Protein kinase domain-containing protein n=1 Tax=Amborella trichopoda TaxID=13333 RepID=W1NN29_AMBTC|nr:probable receptor-like serine/threonine-protein kinase At5g57670 [Amborella trichopoda]ERM96729.1 hypothetical protein AMTR_s00202p00019370 [Amborella trichopoda]|eukprot:XP_006829313.1 probable receptor-like serine/threonine-protein kinase At5g57670 [Amborella trichopoda]
MTAEKKGVGQTVVVGVKLDSHSRELLTWALVKVAEPGDRVVALHVLKNSEVRSNGTSSVLCLAKAFDSILAVYEGFCNLKQVDLKVKICRGSSIRKVMVEEAKCSGATSFIVGITRNNALSSSVSLAKFCAKKLSQECSVLAVNNGKVVFQREASPLPSSGRSSVDDVPKPSLLGSIHRSLSKNSKVLSSNLDDLSIIQENPNATASLKKKPSQISKQKPNSGGVALKPSCHFCSDKTNNEAQTRSEAEAQRLIPSKNQSEEEETEHNPLALVVVKDSKGSLSVVSKHSTELRPGWPLLRGAVLPNKECSEKPPGFRQVSVVQWAMQLPNRFIAIHSENKLKIEGGTECKAIVPFGDASVNSQEEERKELPKELESLHEKYGSTCRLFGYEELRQATSEFSAENLIGKGGSSKVYKGILPDGREIAVKILKSSEDSLQEFLLEIEIVTALSHNNIISLVGFSFEGGNLLLVYYFLCRGSLEDNLHGDKKDKFVIPWAERFKVAVGVAEALDYLHSGHSQPVIHRDVKSSNILLSEEFEPQLSDFGLAKWASTSSSHITCSDVAGTFGYLAPEYFMYGKVNDKIDVYSFGVVLLELLSGRKPISNDLPKGKESLVMWATPLLEKGKVLELVDPTLGDDYDRDQMHRVMLAASLCIRRAARSRPHMSLILKLLKGDDDVVKWARLQLSASEELDGVDEETFCSPDIQSHVNLALHDVDFDMQSVSSVDQSVDNITSYKSLEDYLQGRWSRSSSFD